MHYKSHLSKDKKLCNIIEHHPEIILEKNTDIFLFLCNSILSQQLSIKVAAVFHDRFLRLFKGEKPTSSLLSNIKFESLREIGLSNAKAQYLLNIAAFDLEFGINNEHLNTLDDEDVITYLTRIRGVGRWTAEMILMFTLGRKDVFPMNDLCIQQAMAKLYSLPTSDRKKFLLKIQTIAKKWSPYRTYATMHLWRYKDIN